MNYETHDTLLNALVSNNFPTSKIVEIINDYLNSEEPIETNDDVYEFIEGHL
jgi:hypothetical protein